ncbi:MAG: DUF3465 domain-containing protein [Chthoniobacterales bacterium]
MTKRILLVLCVLGVAIRVGSAAIEIGPETSKSDRRLAYAFEHKLSGFQIRLNAVVIEIFRDHVHSHVQQEFVVRLASGQTLLIVHDKTIGEAVPALRLGNKVTVLGQYRWNDEGGYIVNTTRKADGRKGGWIRRGGRKFE